MFIKAVKKAINALNTEQHSSLAHQGLCELLEKVEQTQSRFVRKPLEWRRTERAVVSLWAKQNGTRTLEEALETADSAMKTKWARQIIEASEVIDCPCEELMYEIKILIDQNNDVQLDVSACHHPVLFHESRDRRNNRMAFWLVVTPKAYHKGSCDTVPQLPLLRLARNYFRHEGSLCKKS